MRIVASRPSGSNVNSRDDSAGHTLACDLFHKTIFLKRSRFDVSGHIFAQVSRRTRMRTGPDCRIFEPKF